MKKALILATLCLTFTTALTLQAADKEEKYTKEKPMIVDGFAVHGYDRQGPKVVEPAPEPKEITPAPSDAIVLFDSKDLSNWNYNRDESTKWFINKEGAMVPNKGAGYIQTKQEFGSCQLHMEFVSPATDKDKKGQSCGNSGVFLMGQYEIQILDSYRNQEDKGFKLDDNNIPVDNHTYPDGQCGALYGRKPPLVNVCRAPGQWQTYDIIFHRPIFEKENSNKVIKPATFTVFHNGILIHDNYQLTGGTGWQGAHAISEYRYHKDKGPLQFQDHGNPVRFRNVWIRELKD